MSKLQKINNDSIESYVSGIPCLVQINSYFVQEPWNGSAHNCPSSDDFYGYTEIEFSIFDRKGYEANWLEKKLNGSDEKRIEQEITNYMNS